MQTQRIGNIAQHQRAHGQLAVHEEVFLPLHNGLRDPQNGVKALLNVLDEPARLLQALLQRSMTITATVATQGASVNVVHAQARHDGGVELHGKLHAPRSGPHRAHDHVGHHDLAFHIGKAPGRPGLQPGDQHHGLTQALLAHATQAGELAKIAPRQQVNRLAADIHGDFQQGDFIVLGTAFVGIFQQVAQLQLQAFAQMACAHAHGLQALQQLEGDGEAVFQLLALFGVIACQRLGQLS